MTILLSSSREIPIDVMRLVTRYNSSAVPTMLSTHASVFLVY